nr:NTP transferase domain-containing protein [Herpetosiphonaceae bacterium]
MNVYALIMAGGSGSRLWPRSRSRQPKQFLPLLSEQTMVQDTAARVQGLIPPERLVIATGQDYVDLAAAQLPAVPREQIIGEPGGRGSAAGIGLGALLIKRQDPEAVMVVLSADHLIRNVAAFNAALQAAVEVARQGFLVTLGITPDEPHTGF